MKSKGLTTFPEDLYFQETPQEKVDAHLAILHDHKRTWAALATSHKASLVGDILNRFAQLSGQWVDRNLAAKKNQQNESGILEEWFVIAGVAKFLHRLATSLRQIDKYASPRLPAAFTKSMRNRTVAHTFPSSLAERLLLPGYHVEVHFPEGVTPAQVKQHQAIAHHQSDCGGTICLVLGAGNVAHLALIDSLTKLFVENKTVILKMNPVIARLGPLYTRCMQPLVDKGFFRLCYGGKHTGTYLVNHDLVDEIHLTGSKKTYEHIVFGEGPQAEIHKANHRLLNNRPFTAELGNVTPVIIMPGTWSDRRLDFAAAQTAGWHTAVAGFGCLSPRVIVTHRQWPLRSAFLKRCKHYLDKEPLRSAYYPGAHERFNVIKQLHPEMYCTGSPVNDQLPWGFIENVNPAAENEICFKHESFCGIMAETALDSPSVENFIIDAAGFCNTSLWGSLVALVVVDPDMQRNHCPRIEEMIDQLDYGSVMVNMYSGMGHCLACAPWGGAPGRTPFAIDSGVGTVNDPFLLPPIHKAVFRGPFTKAYDPMNITTRNRVEFAQSFAKYNMNPAAANFLRLVAIAAKSAMQRSISA
ncbi:MAG: aldehyde dehydrogenase family protein [Chitinivibrionales bacterium]|nr:aldehyde dehydrogenase family protein [Chitinivibrionales bacterium]